MDVIKSSEMMMVIELWLQDYASMTTGCFFHAWLSWIGIREFEKLGLKSLVLKVQLIQRLDSSATLSVPIISWFKCSLFYII